MHQRRRVCAGSQRPARTLVPRWYVRPSASVGKFAFVKVLCLAASGAAGLSCEACTMHDALLGKSSTKMGVNERARALDECLGLL